MQENKQCPKCYRFEKLFFIKVIPEDEILNHFRELHAVVANANTLLRAEQEKNEALSKENEQLKQHIESLKPVVIQRAVMAAIGVHAMQQGEKIVDKVLSDDYQKLQDKVVRLRDELDDGRKVWSKALAHRNDEWRERIMKFKFDTIDLYHKLGKPKVWSESNDGLCDLCEEYIHKKIDELLGGEPQ